jgi:hypothetical protein
MKIKLKNRDMYILSKKKGKPPVLTSFVTKAADYDKLSTCKNIRDDALEYFPRNLMILP